MIVGRIFQRKAAVSQKTHLVVPVGHDGFAAPAGDPLQQHQIGGGVVQPPAGAATQQQLFASLFQGPVSRRLEVGKVLLHRQGGIGHVPGGAAAGVPVPDEVVRFQPGGQSGLQPAVGADHRPVLSLQIRPQKSQVGAGGCADDEGLFGYFLCHSGTSFACWYSRT